LTVAADAVDDTLSYSRPSDYGYYNKWYLTQVHTHAAAVARARNNTAPVVGP